MISREELRKYASKSGLALYQQEKDYLLKTFLHRYYASYEDAVFKGGTAIKYLYGIDRFSEDLDYNIIKKPQTFRAQVKKTLKEITLLGIDNGFIKEESFQDAYTTEIWFHGPLYSGTPQTQNKFTIDAGKRTGTINPPQWKLISSPYPETPQNFLALCMEEKEMLAEKIIALAQRTKGRDLYDVWFMLEKGIPLDHELVEKKAGTNNIIPEILAGKIPSREEYERDLRRLSGRFIPYEQVANEVKRLIGQ